MEGQNVWARRSYWNEQTCWAALAGRTGCGLWDRRQVVMASHDMSTYLDRCGCDPLCLHLQELSAPLQGTWLATDGAAGDDLRAARRVASGLSTSSYQTFGPGSITEHRPGRWPSQRNGCSIVASERLGCKDHRSGRATNSRSCAGRHATVGIFLGIPRVVCGCPGGWPPLLYRPGSQALRAPLRIGVFALSLMGLVWCLRNSRPVKRSSVVGLAGDCRDLHDDDALPSGDQYDHRGPRADRHASRRHSTVVLRPPFHPGDYRRLLRVLTILWVLNGANVLVGILQVARSGNLDA